MGARSRTLWSVSLAAASLVLLAVSVTGEPARWTPASLIDGPLRVPDDHSLQAEIAEALDFRIREEHDLLLDAWEPGELITHARLTQDLLEFRPYGIDALFIVGDELFEYAFRPEDGLGNGLGESGAALYAGSGPRPNMRRAHVGPFGGPDAYSCASCHFVGGPDGAGTLTQNAIFFSTDGDRTLSAEQRNPPHVLGLGPVEALAQEMTRTLHTLRGSAISSAQALGQEVEVPLEAKGVAFGTLIARPDGSLDTTGVEGIDADLVVKPFG